LQIFSALSLLFRQDGNIATSDKFLEYASSLGRELYDVTDPVVGMQTAIGFWLLSYAVSPTDMSKAKHFSKISLSLTEHNSEEDDQITLIKYLIVSHSNLMKPYSKKSQTSSFIQHFASEMSRVSESLNKGLQSARIRASGGSYVDPPLCFPLSSSNSSPQLSSSSSSSSSSSFSSSSLSSSPTSSPSSSSPPSSSPPFSSGSVFPSTLVYQQDDSERAVPWRPVLLDQSTERRLILEGFHFIQEAIYTFCPCLVAAYDTPTEETANIPVGSIPAMVAYGLLSLIQQITEGIVYLPAEHAWRRTDLHIYRSILYRSLGDTERAIDASKKSLNHAAGMNKGNMKPQFGLVAPTFITTYYLMESGFMQETKIGMEIIKRYYGNYKNATAAYDALVRLKNKIDSKIQTIDQYPDFDPNSNPEIQTTEEVTMDNNYQEEEEEDPEVMETHEIPFQKPITPLNPFFTPNFEGFSPVQTLNQDEQQNEIFQNSSPFLSPGNLQQPQLSTLQQQQQQHGGTLFRRPSNNNFDQYGGGSLENQSWDFDSLSDFNWVETQS